MEIWSRRKFFLTSLVGSAAASAGELFAKSKNGSPVVPERSVDHSPVGAPGKRPVMISSANGWHALDKGMQVLRQGGDTLDAVGAAVTVVEDDPKLASFIVKGFKDVVQCLDFSGDLAVFGTSCNAVIVLRSCDVDECNAVAD